MHVSWSSKENEIQAEGLKMWRAQLHSKQSHELMLCPFFACLWCWSSHFNCTDLVLLLVNLVGRPLINFDCAKKWLLILTWLFGTICTIFWDNFCTFTVWWNLKLPHVGRKQNQGCVALAFSSFFRGTGAVPLFSICYPFSSVHQYAKRRQEMEKIGSVRIQGEGAKEGWG